MIGPAPMGTGFTSQYWLGARCSSVVRAFAHGAMGSRIDPSDILLKQPSKNGETLSHRHDRTSPDEYWVRISVLARSEI